MSAVVLRRNEYAKLFKQEPLQRLEDAPLVQSFAGDRTLLRYRSRHSRKTWQKPVRYSIATVVQVVIWRSFEPLPVDLTLIFAVCVQTSMTGSSTP